MKRSVEMVVVRARVPRVERKSSESVRLVLLHAGKRVLRDVCCASEQGVRLNISLH